MAYENLAPLTTDGFRIASVPPCWRWAWDGLIAAVPGWPRAAGPINLVDGISGTLSGAVTYVRGAQSPEINFALNTSVNFGVNAGYATTGAMTLAAFHVPGSTSETCIAAYATSIGASAYQLNYSHNSDLKYTFGNDESGLGDVVSASTYGLGDRNFVIGRRSGDAGLSPTLDVFVNGAIAGTRASTPHVGFVADGTTVWAINRIGAYPTGWQEPSIISNVLLWGRALSDDEIAQLCEDPFGPLRQERIKYIYFGLAPGPQRLYPHAIAASTNLTGTVVAIRDDPDAADANWLTATSATSATDLRVTFPTPTMPPDGLQTFKLRVRKTTGATTPTMTLELRQSNVLRKVLARLVPVTSTTGANIEAEWHNTDLVAPLDGSDVELRLFSQAGYTNFTVGSTAAYSSTGPLLVSSAFLTINEVTCPATVAAGDLLVCQALTRNLYMDSGATMIDPGWTAFPGNTYGTNTTRVHQSLFWRIADGTESGGTIIVRTFGNNVSSMALVCVHRFTSANGFAGTPVENIAVEVGNSPTVTVSRTMTPSDVNQLAVCSIGIAENFPTIGSLTGATGATWTQQFITGSSLESVSLQTADVSSGTAITGGTKTFSGSDEYWSAVTFCITSAPVGVSPVNTVEVGAIEWNCTNIPPESTSYVIASSTFA